MVNCNILIARLICSTWPKALREIWLHKAQPDCKGMHDDVVQCNPQGPLTGRDKALINSLKAGPLQEDEAVIAELDAMLEMDAKAEIEALYEKVGIDAFSEALAHDLMMSAGEAVNCQREMQQAHVLQSDAMTVHFTSPLQE